MFGKRDKGKVVDTGFKSGEEEKKKKAFQKSDTSKVLTKSDHGLNGTKSKVKKPKKMDRLRKKEHILRISTWNIRTMLKRGKMRETVNEMEKCKVDLVAFQETR